MRFTRRIGNHVITGDIGQDPFGSWHRAVETDATGAYKRHVLMRVLLPSIASIPGMGGTGGKITNFIAAGQKGQAVNGTYPVVGGGGKDDQLYIVYELPAGNGGQSLQAVIDWNRDPLRGNHAVEVRHVVGYMQRAAMILNGADALGQKHGYLTPHSIFLTYSGELKIADIGLGEFFAQAVQVDKIPADRAKGLVPYNMLRADGWKRDLQSLGFMFYSLLTGKVIEDPFRMTEEDVRNMTLDRDGVEEAVPAGLKAILGKAMFGSYTAPKAMLDDLNALANESSDLSASAFDTAFLIQNAFRVESEAATKAIQMETEYHYATAGEGGKSHKGVLLAAVGVVAVVLLGAGGYGYKQHAAKAKAEEQAKVIEEQRQADLDRLRKEMSEFKGHSDDELKGLVAEMKHARTSTEKEAVIKKVTQKRKRDAAKIQTFQLKILEVGNKSTDEILAEQKQAPAKAHRGGGTATAPTPDAAPATVDVPSAGEAPGASTDGPAIPAAGAEPVPAPVAADPQHIPTPK